MQGLIELSVILILVLIYLAYVIYRGLKGRRYRGGGLIARTALYFILVFLIVLTPFNIRELEISIVFAVIGIVLGLILPGRVHFFRHRGKLYYRRSEAVLVVWAAAFIARVALEFFVSPGALGLLILDALLAFSAGLIAGEAYRVMKTKKNVLNRRSG
jgi:membrane protein CcdC involved in cytochrome C biogenesis